MTRRESVDGSVSRAVLTLVAALTVLLAALMSAASVAGRALDQGQIAFESDRTGAWNLYLIDVGTTQTVPLTHGTTDAHWPAWSADGQQIAFNSGLQGMASGEIYVMDANGRHPRQITHSDGNHWHPSWSPDGRQLAFMYNFQFIRLINADGSNEHGIGTGFSPTWSPDGQTILYYDDPGRRFNTDVYTVTPDGVHMNNLTAQFTNDWSPVWSPDGRWIVFLSSRENKPGADLYLIDAACTRATNVTDACDQAVKRLTFDNSNLSSPTWSPDSQHLAYVIENPESAALYLIDVDGRNARRLTGVGHAQSPAWRPLTAAD